MISKCNSICRNDSTFFVKGLIIFAGKDVIHWLRKVILTLHLKNELFCTYTVKICDYLNDEFNVIRLRNNINLLKHSDPLKC